MSATRRNASFNAMIKGRQSPPLRPMTLAPPDRVSPISPSPTSKRADRVARAVGPHLAGLELLAGTPWGRNVGPCASRSDGPLARPRSCVAKPIRSEMPNSDSLVARGGERSGIAGANPARVGDTPISSNEFRSWGDVSFSVGGAGPDRLQPEEAVSVPIRAGDRLGDLRKAAVNAAVPGAPVVEDHDPLETAVPFADQQSSGLEPDALARCRAAGCKGTSAPRLEGSVPGLAQAPQHRPIEISECRGLDPIGEDAQEQPSRQMGGRVPPRWFRHWRRS